MCCSRGWVVQGGAGDAQQCLGTQHPTWERILLHSAPPCLDLKSQPGPGISHLTFPFCTQPVLLLWLVFPVGIVFGPC